MILQPNEAQLVAPWVFTVRTIGMHMYGFVDLDCTCERFLLLI